MTLSDLNVFIEDTCVLATAAYLMARGRTLDSLISSSGKPTEQARLGLLLGLLAASESVFPFERSPYVTHTLLITLASLRGGLLTGIVASLVALLGFSFSQQHTFLLVALAMMICLAAGRVAHLAEAEWPSRWIPPLCGAAAQAGVVILYRFQPFVATSLPNQFTSGETIIANGMGLGLFQWIIGEARKQSVAEAYRLEAERALTLASEAQLSALRARIHPHFLFNALTSIAALCRTSASSAEKSLLRLSTMLRRMLDTPTNAQITVQRELEYVTAYLDIEQLRLGDRLSVEWQIDEACRSHAIPAFSLQTLVENAVQHGVASGIGAGTITICVLDRAKRIVFAVKNTGKGIDIEARRKALSPEGEEKRGLQIVARQLELLHGRSGRLRLYSAEESGTLAAFSVPLVMPSGKDRI